MTRFDLGAGPPAGLAEGGGLYLLGVGGPERADEVGRVEAFTWRFALVEGGAGGVTAIAFSAMPRLIAATRAVNGRRPFSLPTEALRVAPSELGPAPGVALVVDPSDGELEALLATGRVVERRLPALEGGAP